MTAGRLYRALAVAALICVTGVPTGLRAAEGPYEVATGDYQFLDRSERLVAKDRQVDLWAEVYRPKRMGASPRPLLVFLHGNHATCGRFDKQLGVRVDDNTQYTRLGTCPSGYVVTPNHLGYGYLARELASWGFVVVSINANRGITAGYGVNGDSGLNLMRGRLILRHLALLADWNRGVGDLAPPASLGFDPKGMLDFAQVGLMGHSRGGEGARAALQQYRDAKSPLRKLIGDMTIRSIFEIGPVDGQTSRVLDADGVNSVVLLPGCDGDVSDLQGVKVFDRVFSRAAGADPVKAFHGTVEVWGANHNAYNSEWLTSDSPGCAGARKLFSPAGRSAAQEATALGTAAPFFRATVGSAGGVEQAALFDPAVALPSELMAVTRYDRGYLAGPVGDDTVVLERFAGPTGQGDAGAATTAVGVSVEHVAAGVEHDGTVRVARVAWDAASPGERYFQVNFDAAGKDLSNYEAFAFRVAVRCFAKICSRPSSEKGETDFTVSLMSGGASSRALKMASRTHLGRPTGTKFYDNLHSVLQTVSFPLREFGRIDLTRVTGVRFTFERKEQGAVDISDLTASTFAAAEPHAETTVALGDDRRPASVLTSVAASENAPRPTSTRAIDGNRIAVVRGAAPAAGRTAAAEVRIVLTSKRAFPVTSALPKLKIGSRSIRGGELSTDGRTMTFAVPAAEFVTLDGDVSLDLLASRPVWMFGRLPK